MGSRDRRLLPVAAAVWATMLLHGATGGPVPRIVGAVGVGAVCIAVPVAVAVRACRSVRSARRPASLAQAMRYAAVLSMAAATALLACCAHEAARSSSFVAATLAEGATHVTAIVRPLGPATSSDRRDADCRVDAAVQALTARGVTAGDAARTRVYADGDACALGQGVTYRIRGLLETPRFGRATSWLTVSDARTPETVEPATAPRRAALAMQTAFIRVTQRLDDQGRLLVPGVTLGLIGSGIADPTMRDASIDPPDATYAAQVEEAFRRAGIMHLMAVSGGHFAIVAALVRRLCARMRLPRAPTALAVAGGYVALSAAMGPSDSVSRASVMGMVGVAAYVAGRRGQGISMLCVTVIAALLMDPALAGSIGFALSCAAVLGIVLWARPAAAWLAGRLPAVVADALAVTLAAQTLAMPLQVLMEPQLPQYSAVANLLVAPVVAFSTLAGLVSLTVSWCCPPAGFACAWVAACGTAAMERVALWCSALPFAAVPWLEGPPAALLLLAAEGAGAFAVRQAMRLAAERGRGRGRSAAADVAGFIAAQGRPYAPTAASRVRMWMRETRGMMSTDEA